MPVERPVGPAVVIDKSAEAARTPTTCWASTTCAPRGRARSAARRRLAAAAHGLGRRAHDQAAFLNADATGPHTPGFDAECAEHLATATPLAGVGVETVGTDAGAAHSFDPPFPVHHQMLGAGRYGLTQLANLALLPPTGALLIVAPLKLVGGTGSPAACSRSSRAALQPIPDSG